MPNFTHVEVQPEDSELLDELYQFGVANPTPVEFACGPEPYILRADLQKLAEDPDFSLFAVSDEDGLRMVTSIRRSDGLFGHTVFKRYGTGPDPHPSGIELSKYQAMLAIRTSGTAKANDNFEEYHAQIMDEL